MILQFQKKDLRFLATFVLPFGAYVLLAVTLAYTVFQNDLESILFLRPAFWEPFFKQYAFCTIIVSGLFFLAISLDVSIFSITKGTSMTRLDVSPFLLLSSPMIATGFFSWTFFSGGAWYILSAILLGTGCVCGWIFSSKDRSDDEIVGSIISVVGGLAFFILWRVFELPFFYLTLTSISGFGFYLLVRIYNFGGEITYGRMVTAMFLTCLGFICIGLSVKFFTPKPIVYVKTTLHIQANMTRRYRTVSTTVFVDTIKTPAGWVPTSNTVFPKVKIDTEAIDVSYAQIVGSMDFLFPKNMPNEEKVKMIPDRWQNRGKFKDGKGITYELLAK